jgi:hypothetical protein
MLARRHRDVLTSTQENIAQCIECPGMGAVKCDPHAPVRHTKHAVAKHLNFRAAADELALTQSAVSRQIQALEEEVGVPLFLRHTRAVELTSAGAQLHRAVGPAIERMDAAVRLVRQTAGRAAWPSPPGPALHPCG